MCDLENRFHAAMLQIYERAKEQCDYNANYFLQSVNEHGGVATAHSLLAQPGVSEGFTRLWECGCLHITLECLVLHPKYRKLFTKQELAVAHKRLTDCGFDCAQL